MDCDICTVALRCLTMLYGTLYVEKCLMSPGCDVEQKVKAEAKLDVRKRKAEVVVDAGRNGRGKKAPKQVARG
jgi:hypothetical protein